MTCSIGHISCVIVSFVRHIYYCRQVQSDARVLRAPMMMFYEIILGIIALVVDDEIILKAE